MRLTLKTVVHPIAPPYFAVQNIKALVVACNTAMAAAINRLRTLCPHLPIIGVEPALKPAVALGAWAAEGVEAKSGPSEDSF